MRDARIDRSSVLTKLMRRVDARLGTAPLFAVAIAGDGARGRSRITIALLTTLAVLRYRILLVGWAVREQVEGAWWRGHRRGRVGKRGLRPVVELADGRWSQVADIASLHRCRAALGKLSGTYGRAGITLYCGYHPISGPLPAYVFVDHDERIVELAFDTGEGSISPGIGWSLPSGADAGILRALSAYLGNGTPDEESVALFLGDR